MMVIGAASRPDAAPVAFSRGAFPMPHPIRWLPVALLLLAPGALAGQDGPATRRARELVGLINSATPASIKAYVDTAFGGPMQGLPLDAHVGFFMGQREQTKGLDWVSASESNGEATAVVKRRLTGDPLALGIRVESTAPHKVIGVGQRPVPPGAAAPASRVATDEALSVELSRFVEQLAAADVFSGAVMVSHDGKVVYSGAFGIANRDFNAANNIDTRFNLGSMNKMFTGVAIAQLVELGKVSYEDPLSKFVPDFPSAEAAKKIRIKHLLTHTSGLGSYFNDTFDRSSRALYRTVDEMMKLAAGDSLAFEPGSRWSYSNTGMLVLGKVIEVASGQDYFSYIRDNVYRPAGMASSDSYELDYVNPNLAVGYEKEFQNDGSKRYRNNVFMHVIRGGPAGGGYSTVGDLQRFAAALTSGKLVSAASYELLTTPKPDIASPRYGYGFGVDTRTGIVGHSGGFPGISSNLDIFKGTGWVAVVQSNYGGGSQPVVEKIRTLVAARRGQLTP